MTTVVGNNGNGSFDIRNFTDRLTPSDQKGKFICPVCEGNDFSIRMKDGAYSCLNNGCEPRKIRDAIAPITKERVDEYRRQVQRPKTEKEKRKEREAIASAHAWEVEQKAIELAMQYDPPLVSEAKLANEISVWAKEFKHDAFEAKRLLKEKIVLQSEQINGRQAENAASQTGLHSIEVNETHYEVNRLVHLASQKLDLRDVLPPKTAEAMLLKARSMPVPVEYLLQPFLSITGGIIGARAEVELKRGYTEPCIFWTGIVSAPGTKKSPAIKALSRPLARLQKREHDRYKLDLENYKQAKKDYDALPPEEKRDCAEPTEPAMRDYYIDRYTTEALVRIHSEAQNQNGFVVIKDELKGLFGAQNQYKGGNGDDRETLLSLWGGDAVKQNLTSSKLFIEKTAVSIVGGVQAKVLDRMMGSHDDEDGMWGRFLWVAPGNVRSYWSDAEVDFSDFMEGFYAQLDRLEAETYHLSTAAKSRYVRFVNWLEDQRIMADEGMQNFLSKLMGYTARLALWLHIIWAVETGSDIHDDISPETMKRAIQLALFYLNQLKILRGVAIADSDAQLPSKLLKILQLSQQVGAVTVRDIRRKNWGKTAEEVKEFFTQLDQMGYGKISEVVKGRQKTFQFLAGVDDPRGVDRAIDTSDRHLKPLSNIEIRSGVEGVDQNSASFDSGFAKHLGLEKEDFDLDLNPLDLTESIDTFDTWTQPNENKDPGVDSQSSTPGSTPEKSSTPEPTEVVTIALPDHWTPASEIVPNSVNPLDARMAERAKNNGATDLTAAPQKVEATRSWRTFNPFDEE